MDVGLIGRAVAMFAVTNVDDLVLLAVFFGQAAGRRGELKVVAGQFLGFAAILAASVAGALGAGLLPDGAVRWLGVLPVLLGIRAAWQAWHRDDDEPAPASGVLAVAAVCFANGGDNIGVYVPAFAATGPAGLVGLRRGVPGGSGGVVRDRPLPRDPAERRPGPRPLGARGARRRC